MPRDPRSPRSASSVTASLTRSATDIGRKRSVSRICRRPRGRKAFSRLSPLTASRGGGDAGAGGSGAWRGGRRAARGGGGTGVGEEKGGEGDVEEEDRLCILWPPGPELFRRSSLVAPQREGGAVGGWREGGDGGLDHLKAVRGQPQVVNDAGTETANVVGDDRSS